MEIGFKRSVFAQEIPASNYIIMMLATVTFAIQMIGNPKQQYLNGYMWLHMSMAHIVGNLITLWIFGRYLVSAGKHVPLMFYPVLLIFFQNFRKSGDFLANRV